MNNDPLFVVSSKRRCDCKKGRCIPCEGAGYVKARRTRERFDVCSSCGNNRKQRKNCEACGKVGYTPNRRGEWMKCKVCHGTKQCQTCRGSQFQPVDMSNHWAPSPAFLVCGGPSLAKVPIECLRERGVLSLGINNAAAYAPCSAMTFGDPQFKFHSAIHLDGKCMVFAPTAKLTKHIRVKTPNGFRSLDVNLCDCPNVYGYARSGRFSAEDFLSTYYAHWGYGGKEDDRPFSKVTTMLLGLRILHYLGCPRVYMLGVDFHQPTKQEAYAWGAGSGGNSGWHKIDSMLSDIRGTFERHNFQVLNCNPDSKCKAFDFATFDEAIADCRSVIPREPLDLSDWYSHKIRERDAARWPERVGLSEAKLLLRGAE